MHISRDPHKPRLTLTCTWKTNKCFAKLSLGSSFPKQVQTGIHSKIRITVFILWIVRLVILYTGIGFQGTCSALKGRCFALSEAGGTPQHRGKKADTWCPAPPAASVWVAGFCLHSSRTPPCRHECTHTHKGHGNASGLTRYQAGSLPLGQQHLCKPCSKFPVPLAQSGTLCRGPIHRLATTYALSN